MQSPINRPEDAPSAVGCASSLGRESGVGGETVKEEILHRGQNWALDEERRGGKHIVGSEGYGKGCEWRDRRRRHPGRGPLRLVWGRMREVELLVLAWECRRGSGVTWN